MTHACIKLTNSTAKVEDGQAKDKKDSCSGGSCVADIEQAREKKLLHTKYLEEKEEESCRDDEGEKNLDSGYAWIILAVMFLLASSTCGTNRVYGLIYAKQVAIGYYDHEQASWPIATASTVENLAGLMTPALAQYLTWRQMELMATLLFVTANVGAYFSESLAIDILCLGIIQGLALSINTVLSLVINNDYFKRYRTTAYGISLSGSTFGILYLGPIVSWCLERDELEFRSGYLAIGCVLALNALLVIFIKPRDKTKSEQMNKKKKKRKNENSSSRELAACPVERKRSLLERHLERKNSVASIALMCKQKRQSDLQRPSALRSSSIRKEREPQTQNNFQVIKSLGHQHQPIEKRSLSTNEFNDTIWSNGIETENKQNKQKFGLFSAQPLEQQQQQQQHDGGSSHYYANIFIKNNKNNNNHGRENDGEDEERKEVNALPLFHTNLSPNLSNRSSLSSDLEQPTISSEISQQASDINKTPGTSDINQGCQRDESADGKLSSIVAAAAARAGGSLDINNSKHEGKCNDRDTTDEGLSAQLVGALLRSPYLHCVWIMLSLYYLIARIFIIILVDLAKDNGLSSSESRSLLNYWSVGEIVGRIVLCSFVDLQWLSVRACILLTCTSMSLCIGLMAVLSGTFYLYAICSALVAALISLEYVLINVLMIEYLGQSRVTSCYSVGSFISSLALLGRPALIGLFRDQLGSYNGLLLLLAGLSLLYGLLFGLMEPLLVRYWPKRQLHHRRQLREHSTKIIQ